MTNIQTLYEKLLTIEETKGQKEAETFLELRLHNDGFDDYVAYVEELKQKQLKGALGVFKKLFK